MRTIVPFGDPKAVRKWSGKLFLDTLAKSYFNRRFIGESDNSAIQRLTDLESGPGDSIHYDLSVQLRGDPTYGDNVAEGTEEDLKFFGDDVYIDQLRKPVSQGGKMTQKRTAHDLRKTAKDRLSDYWSKFMDEMHFIYLSGARGVNGFYQPLNWSGHANNPIQAPDSGHIMYSGAATSKATVTNTDTMTRQTIEKAVVKARMMRELDVTDASVLPLKINGEDHYVALMSPFDEYNMRTAAGDTGWLEIQKAAAAAEGKNNPIFKGGLGMINNVVLHSHESVVRFNDYGTGTNLPASRTLFMGRQAGVVAYGSSSGMRFSWKEELKDYGNLRNVIAGTIMGIKKTRFNGKDFGIISIDSYAKDPNA